MATIKLKIKVEDVMGSPGFAAAVSQKGLKAPEVKKFLDTLFKSMNLTKGTVVAVQLIVDNGKFELKSVRNQPTSKYLKDAAGITKGSASSAVSHVGYITKDQLREIAKIKISDTNAHTIEKAMSIIESVGKAMGIRVK